MEYVWFPLFIASVLAFVGFRQWLRHQQRAMVHRERLAALEKGADLPAWPDEAPSRFDFGLDSVLLSVWLDLAWDWLCRHVRCDGSSCPIRRRADPRGGPLLSIASLGRRLLSIAPWHLFVPVSLARLR